MRIAVQLFFLSLSVEYAARVSCRSLAAAGEASPCSRRLSAVNAAQTSSAALANIIGSRYRPPRPCMAPATTGPTIKAKPNGVHMSDEHARAAAHT